MTQPELGPPIARLGPLLKGRAGAFNIAGHVVGMLASAGLCLPGLLALSLYLFEPDSARATLYIGIALLLTGVLLAAFVIVSFVQYAKLHVTVHQNGLVIGQPWFRTISVAWTDVADLSPPDGAGMFHSFTLTHRSGTRVLVNRLCLSPRDSLEHGRVHHPDVQRVLDLHAEWLRRHDVA